MNVGNIQLHQWIITINPDIVESYIQLYDDNPFKPIFLNCTVGEENNDLKGNLNSLVTFKTHCKYSNKKNVLLSLGLGKYVALNAIISKTDLKKVERKYRFWWRFLSIEEIKHQIFAQVHNRQLWNASKCEIQYQIFCQTA